MASTMIKTFRSTRPTHPLRLLTPIVQRRTMASGHLSSYLVSPAELNAALQKNASSKISSSPKVIPLCATWFLPNDPKKRTGLTAYKAARIPHARFFDLDAVKDTESPYPHMLPSPTDFATAMGNMGIRRDDSVVVYDDSEDGIFSAPRVAWTLRVFGHPSLHLLNNFKLWCEEGYPTDSGIPEKFEKVEYPIVDLDTSQVVDFKEMKTIARKLSKLSGAIDVQILDARSQGRWAGRDPEPRPGLPSGHMPGSISVPVPELLDPSTKKFKSPTELKALFRSKGVDPSKPIINSCGTGVTATVIDAALTEAGYPENNRRLYDGSWTEWAQRVKPEENLIHTSD